jgi:hypothetical protein
MKSCAKCKILKPLSDFGKRKNGKNGLRSMCKICTNAQTRDWQHLNREKCNLNNKNWRENNKDKKRVSDKKGRQKWEQSNRGTVNAKTAKRRAAKLCATPPWLSELQNGHIKMFYETSAFLTKELGIKFHVDHIIPLQGENVSGLHVPWNLQVISESDNCSKRNKVENGI